jgi:hypothetical protein
VVDDEATDTNGGAAPAPTICSTEGLNHKRDGDNSVGTPGASGETAVGANSLTSLMLGDIQHSSLPSVESDFASTDAQLDVTYELHMAASHVCPSQGFQGGLHQFYWHGR